MTQSSTAQISTGPGFFNVDPTNPTATPPVSRQVIPAVGSTIAASASWSFGPLEIDATYANGGIDFEIKLLGTKIGSGRLDPGKASVSVGVDIGLAKVGLVLKADFGKRELVVDGQACTRNWHGGWDCGNFNTVILRW